MDIVLVGLNHKVAPVEIRERLAFGPSLQADAQAELLCRTMENVILSTCNRTEVYAVPRDEATGMESVVDFLGEYHGLARERYVPYLYCRRGTGVVDHLFNVAAGLDSMIVGEPQILGQVRDAFEAATARHAAGPVLSRAFSQAVKVGKRVRSETAISRHAVSVSYAAVELARKIFGGLAGRRVLVVGAGKMGELAARTLLDNGLSDLVVTNRTFNKAEELAAKFGGRAAEFARLPQLLAETDVAITSTGAPDFVLTRALVAEAMALRGESPLFLIDIAVPRDVDPDVRGLDNVVLHDIDDLQAVCAANMEERRREGGLARGIIEGELADFDLWWESQRMVPTIAALRQRAEEIRLAEMQKTLGRLGDLSDRQRNSLDALTSAIVNKLLHQPITRLKEKSTQSEGSQYALVLRELFALDE